MALPLLFAGGAAATIGSSLLGNSANKKAAQAKSAAYGAERDRQAGYDSETGAINTGAQDRYQNFSGQQDQRATELTDLFRTRPADSPAIIPQTGNDLVQRAIDVRMATAKSYGEQQSAALAKLRAFGDLLGGINRLQGRDASRIAQIGGFKRGSAAVNELELDAAGHSADDTRFWSDILGGLGKVAMNAGLAGKFDPGGLTVKAHGLY